jgi:putative membrane protein
MSPIAQAALRSWSLPIPLSVSLLVAAFFYLRGWIRLKSKHPSGLEVWRAASFCAGLLLIWIALGSSLAAFDEQLLTVHMLQHLLLMTVAPALILLGAPMMPFLHGLPRSLVHDVLGPVLRWPPVQKIGSLLARPAVCFVAAAAALIGWHVPAAFTLGLQSEFWHVVEHSCFITAGFLFWWPVIRPWPSVTSGSRWPIVLYLFLATIPCDILSGFLAFSDRLAYPIYLSAPRSFALSALEDQQAAAALMWTCVTVAYLIPAVIVTVRLLNTRTNFDPALASNDHSIAFRYRGKAPERK